jgi:hypothetical protein
MSKHHHVEAMRKADSHEHNHKFLDLFADIKGFPQTQNDLCDSLLTKQGTLPNVEILHTESGTRTGKPATRADLTEAGAKRTYTVDKDGAQTTTVDYGNGVTISSSDGHKPIDLGNCHKITFSHNMDIQVKSPNHLKLNGNVEDREGRIIAKRNKDGSYTVDTGEGFFTQRSDGTVRKETAIRTRKPHEKHFHDFDVIDTETPLGSLKPDDLTHHH